jgi:hypothetical protein
MLKNTAKGGLNGEANLTLVLCSINPQKSLGSSRKGPLGDSGEWHRFGKPPRTPINHAKGHVRMESKSCQGTC